MKKLFLMLVLPLLISVSNYCSGKDLQNLGLISQLVEIKYGSEGYLTTILADPASTDPQKKAALKKYNNVRMQIDRIIYQMTVDMRAKNSPKLYKGLNKYYRSNRLYNSDNLSSKYASYGVALNDAYNSFREFVPLPPAALAGIKAVGIEEITAVFELGWTIFKDFQEMQGKKVDGIVEILEKVSLSSPADLEKGSPDEDTKPKGK